MQRSGTRKPNQNHVLISKSNGLAIDFLVSRPTSLLLGLVPFPRFWSDSFDFLGFGSFCCGSLGFRGFSRFSSVVDGFSYDFCRPSTIWKRCRDPGLENRTETTFWQGNLMVWERILPSLGLSPFRWDFLDFSDFDPFWRNFLGLRGLSRLPSVLDGFSYGFHTRVEKEQRETKKNNENRKKNRESRKKNNENRKRTTRVEKKSKTTDEMRREKQRESKNEQEVGRVEKRITKVEKEQRESKKNEQRGSKKNNENRKNNDNRKSNAQVNNTTVIPK